MDVGLRPARLGLSAESPFEAHDASGLSCLSDDGNVDGLPLTVALKVEHVLHGHLALSCQSPLVGNGDRD